MFEHIPPFAGDPILSLMEDFSHDSRPQKINLSIGLYYDEHGVVPQLASITQAQKLLQNSNAGQAAIYLPMDGLASFNQATQRLLLGDNSSAVQQNRAVTVQSIGGSGALKIGADFLWRYFPNSQVWVSQPTWDNHISIFTGAGFKVNYYPYFDNASLAVDFAAMLYIFKQLPSQSIVLLHPCCHNPTGADLTKPQWDEILAICLKRNLIVFFDLAYQGFANSLADDAYAIRKGVELNLTMLIASSYSKNFSLYASRVGALTVLCPNSTIAQTVLGQLKFTVRSNYSVPPLEGASLVAKVLTTPELSDSWQQELATMRKRIIAMRQTLATELLAINPALDCSYLTRQQGMFSYTGLSSSKATHLREKYAIYILASGRICLAGLNHSNVKYVAQALAIVLA